MKISIIGTGYVGLTSAVCFTKLGHKIVAIDINKEKVEKIKAGVNPLKEVKKLGNYLKKYLFECLLGQHRKAVNNSDLTMICVNTPTKKNGQLDLIPLKKVCRTLGQAIRKKKYLGNKKYHIFVIRSTIFPGSLDILRKEIEKTSRKKCGKDFDLAVNPEFLREKHAIDDFFDPSFIIVGSDKQRIAEKVMSLYDKIDAKKFIVDEGIGQMIKYLNNSWHSCKVAYTNEIGSLCKKLGIDSKKLMEIFVQDTKLNVSPYYHIPGKAFSGSCLPKDLAVLQNNIKKLKINCPIIQSIEKSNEIQKKRDEK